MTSTRLDGLELRAWQSLLYAHHDVVGTLDTELRERHGITFSEYDVLLPLARAPERALSVGELAERTMLSPSGTTRLVDRGIRENFTGRLSRRQLEQVASALETIAGVHAPH
jgi:DNA-binding MarR family transcriptional regulator